MYADIELYLSLTEKCNWNCFYCGYPLKTQPKEIDLDWFKGTIKDLKPVTDKYDLQLCVEGGETGLVSEDILDYLFFESNMTDKQQFKWHVASNGTFMLKRYHDKYKDVLRSILYHVVPDLVKPNMNFKKYQCDGYDIYPTIVIHKENIQYLSSFLDQHTDEMFVLHVIQRRIEHLDIMDKSYYQQIYDIVKDKPNVVQDFKDRYKYILSNYDNTRLMDLKRSFCCHNYKKMIIDFPNRVINRCCISMESDTIPLTPENLDKCLSNTQKIFTDWDDACNDCIGGFIFRDHSLAIRREVMTKMKTGTNND